MIHARQSVRSGLTAQVPTCFRAVRAVVVVAALVLVTAPAACGDGGIQPGDLRYGQLGSIRVSLDAPLRLGVGRLSQTLEWGSDGAWTLQEAISYNGSVGDEHTRRSALDGSQFAAYYASLITQLNETDGLQIVGFPPLWPDTVPEPECGQTRTRVSFTIRDEPTNDETRWVRCAEGSLANLTPEGAGPDAAASRIAQAAILARDYTVGERVTSAYAGSVPFRSLDRGHDLVSGDRTSKVFTDSADFRSFWGQAAGGRPLPAVDFSKEMVILGVAGVREEAGDSVEVRRILQVDQGTLIEVWERVPGDFCSPVAQVHTPYHVVVAPITPSPLRFSQVQVELVPCGG